MAEDEYERQTRAQLDLNDEVQKKEAAWSMVGQSGLLDKAGQARFIEVIGDPDIDRENDPNDDLKDKTAGMLSRLHMLTSLKPDEVRFRRIVNPNRAKQLKAQHPRRHGVGSKCRGEVRSIMTGESEPMEALDPDLAQRYDEAVEVKESMEALARDGKAWDGMTRIHAVAETDSNNTANTSSSSGSALSRIGSILPGRGS